MILRQLLLCGLLVPRAQMAPVLGAISNVMPMSYAVDAMRHLSRQPHATAALYADVGIVLGFAVVAIGLGAATLRRRTG